MSSRKLLFVLLVAFIGWWLYNNSPVTRKSIDDNVVNQGSLLVNKLSIDDRGDVFVVHSKNPDFSIEVSKSYTVNVEEAGFDNNNNGYNSVAVLEKKYNDGVFSVYIHRTYSEEMESILEKSIGFDDAELYNTKQLTGYKATYQPDLAENKLRNMYILSAWEDYYLHIIFWNFRDVQIDEDEVLNSITLD